MIDLVNGKIRIRKWPRPRRRAKSTAQQLSRDKFAAAQRAAKYIAPQIMRLFTEATAGTPLLPRDLSTMMLYNRMYAFHMPDGRKVFPMPAYLEVSDALDVISNMDGMTLVRGANGWEALPYGGGAGGWEMLKFDDMTTNGAIPYSQLDGVTDYNEIYAIMDSVYMQTLDSMRIACSVDDGVNWITANSAYSWIRDFGRLDANGPPFMAASNNQRPTSGTMQILNFPPGVPNYFNSQNNAEALITIAGQTDRITNLKIYCYNNSSLLTGKIIWMGRV